MKKPLILLGLALHVLANSTMTNAAPTAECAFYVGTYTKPQGSTGIYRYRLNTTTGALTARGLAVETPNPTFLALAPNRWQLYAVNEIRVGTVSAFSIAADGTLNLINQQSSYGDGPCHLAVDESRKSVLVANYGSGSVAALPILADGSLGEVAIAVSHVGSGPNPKRQQSPHAHGIYTRDALAYACDLGTDDVRIYRLDAASGALTLDARGGARLPPGSGPRHLAFHGNFAYVINELLNTIAVFRCEALTGELTPIQRLSTLPAGYTNPSTAAEIFIRPDGKFLYASNRGHDSLAVFSIGSDGTLTLINHASTQGRTPRSFALDPSGRWLIAANQDSGNLVVFEIDATTGKLTPAGHTAQIAEPVCVLFVP